MIIGTIANPEWIHKETDYKIDSGRSLLDLHPEDIQTECKFLDKRTQDDIISRTVHGGYEKKGQERLV